MDFITVYPVLILILNKSVFNLFVKNKKYSKFFS